MTSDDLLVVFLDANVLSKAVTRTLLLRCQSAGYTAVWSQVAEEQAERHQKPRHLPVSAVRERVGLVLSKPGADAQRFAGTDADDRQILADAEVDCARAHGSSAAPVQRSAFCDQDRFP